MLPVNNPNSWTELARLTECPLNTFEQLKTQVDSRKFTVGIDPMAAAVWVDSSRGVSKVVIGALSLFLVAAAVAAIILAVWLDNYWLLAAVPAEAAGFYLSDPSARRKGWITVAGIGCLVICFELLLNGFPTAALPFGYAGLAFGVVRVAAFVNASAFRKALLSDEARFSSAYASGSCTLRETGSTRVYGCFGAASEV